MLKLKEYPQVKVLLWQQLGNRQSGSFRNLNNEKNTDTQCQITQAKSFNKFPPGASGNKQNVDMRVRKPLKILTFSFLKSPFDSRKLIQETASIA